MPRETARQGFSQPAVIPKGRRSATKLKRDKYISRVMNGLAAEAPWLQTVDRPLLRAFCQCERMASELYQLARDEGLIKSNGEPHPALAKYFLARKVQAQIANLLGFAPAARANLQNAGVLREDLTGLLAKAARLARDNVTDAEVVDGQAE